MEKPTARRPGLLALTTALAVLLATQAAFAFRPDSPEVKQLVERGVKFLESKDAIDGRVGAQAVAGLALLKYGVKPDHPKVVAAANAIESEVARAGTSGAIGLDIYATGLSIIFLVTLEPTSAGTHSPAVNRLLQSLASRQKQHGGWGYPERPTGDTSMTQYGVLSSWEAAQVGYQISPQSIEAVLLWLMHTQDPSGGFGYQGSPSPSFVPVAQEDVRPSVSVAGLGSVYICSDLLGFSELAKQRQRKKEKLPPALREIQARAAVKSRIDLQTLLAVQTRGNQFMQTKSAPYVDRFVYYFLYALERYSSFREAVEGFRDAEPAWYNEGVKFLMANQVQDGAWEGAFCGKVCDTAFGILFLLRSSKKSIERVRDFGAGVLVGGRGLPRNASDLELRGGRVTTKPLLGPAERLLASIDDVDDLDVEEELDNLSQLPTEDVRTLVSRQSEKLRRLAGSNSPDARIAAVRTLARSRDLDQVPLLISALRDKDVRVVQEAENGLRRISRRIGGERLPDAPTEAERAQAIKSWKAWYLGIRPDAHFDE